MTQKTCFIDSEFQPVLLTLNTLYFSGQKRFCHSLAVRLGRQFGKTTVGAGWDNLSMRFFFSGNLSGIATRPMANQNTQFDEPRQISAGGVAGNFNVFFLHFSNIHHTMRCCLLQKSLPRGPKISNPPGCAWQVETWRGVAGVVQKGYPL